MTLQLETEKDVSAEDVERLLREYVGGGRVRVSVIPEKNAADANVGAADEALGEGRFDGLIRLIRENPVHVDTPWKFNRDELYD